MTDPFRDFAEQTRRMHELARAYELACSRALNKLTPEQEHNHPGARLALFRKRKAARELLAEFEKLDIDCLMTAIEGHFTRIDFEGDGQ